MCVYVVGEKKACVVIAVARRGLLAVGGFVAEGTGGRMTHDSEKWHRHSDRGGADARNIKNAGGCG